MLKAKTKIRKFRKSAANINTDVKAPLVEALENFYKNLLSFLYSACK